MHTHDKILRGDLASPAALIVSIATTYVIDAHEGRDVISADIPKK